MPAIAVVTEKGGVAKTTTAVNVAAALARRDPPLRVLVVDLDSQGHAGKALGAPRGSGPDIGSVLWGGMDVREAIRRQPRIPGVDVLAGSLAMAEYDIDVADRADREGLIAEMLQPVRPDYDLILLDLPPRVGLIYVGAYMAADYVLAPLCPEADPVQGYLDLTDHLARAQASLQAPARLLGALITMADLGTREHRQNIAEIRDTLGDEVLATIIRQRTAVREASRNCQTVIEYAPYSDAAFDYTTAADEILARINTRGA